jgi:hypothetical protein
MGPRRGKSYETDDDDFLQMVIIWYTKRIDEIKSLR